MISELIAEGHSKKDLIENYTIDQFNAFVRASRKRKTGKMLDTMVAIRTAVWADKTTWINMVRELREPNGKARLKSYVSSKAEVIEFRRLMNG